MNLKASMSFLENWVYKKGWDIEYTSHGDCIDFDNKIIFINSRQSAKRQYYALIHEIGHFLISKNKAFYKNNHPVQYQINVEYKKPRPSKKQKVDKVLEEINAWNKGKELARRNKLYFKNNEYFGEVSESIYSYFKWATK